MSSLRTTIGAAMGSQRPLVTPGAYDAFSARLIAAAGFEAVYVTGAGLSNSRLGLPDIGMVDLTQLVEQVSAMSDVVDLPLIVDADTGFGNAVTVTRTVRRLERAGAAAVQIEDQVSPKRCGHFIGKDVVPVADMLQKIQAALDSRRDADFLVIARTDARASEGMSGALDRAEQYQAAGADLIFVEAPRSVEELELIGRTVKGPLVANMVEGGVTPIVGQAELGRLGFALVLYANSALRAAQRSISAVLARLRSDGSTQACLDLLSTWQERQEAVGKPYFDNLEERYKS